MGVSGAVAATVGLMRPLGICGGLAGLFAGKPAPTGGACWPLEYRTPDATKPALGGLRWLRLVGRGNLNRFGKLLICKINNYFNF